MLTNHIICYLQLRHIYFYIHDRIYSNLTATWPTEIKITYSKFLANLNEIEREIEAHSSLFNDHLSLAE